MFHKPFKNSYKLGSPVDKKLSVEFKVKLKILIKYDEADLSFSFLIM